MKKENELPPAIDSTIASEKVVSVETSLLKSNAFKEELYAIDKAYEGLLNSIKNFGLKEPLIVDVNTNEVISGNRRLKAVLELGYEHIPVIFRNPGDADREILYISHENQREKTYSQYLNEFKIIQTLDFVISRIASSNQRSSCILNRIYISYLNRNTVYNLRIYISF